MKIAVVRGFGGLRRFDINFYEHCKSLEISFIHPQGMHFESSLVSFSELKLTPAFGFDPVSKFLGHPHLLSWSYLDNLESELKEVDVVNTIEPYFFLSKQCAKICEKTKKPLVVSVFQNIENHFSKFVPPYSSNSKFVSEKTTLFIAFSAKAKSYLQFLGVSEEKIKIIHPGIDLQVFKPSNQIANNDVPRILFVGNLTNYKGLPELLKACDLLRQTGVKFELWICGGGDLDSMVQAYAKKLSCIKYLGFVSSGLSEIYRECDIFCLPSKNRNTLGLTYWEEQFGFVFLEAMASGLPIVTTDSGSIPEVVGSNNFVVHQGSTNELRDALELLITDISKRRQIGTMNRNSALNRFDINKQIAALESEFLKLK